MNPKITNNTLVDYPRLENLLKYLAQTDALPGLVAEVGVYKGGTAYLLCDNTHNTGVLLFDTFQGMPKVNEHDLHHEGDFADTSLPAVSELLKDFNHKVLIKGVFPKENAGAFENCTFRLVHLDCDIYDSVKECLEFFYPRMAEGGIIILDDYNEPNCPGAKRATQVFMADKDEDIVETVQSQAIIIKV